MNKNWLIVFLFSVSVINAPLFAELTKKEDCLEFLKSFEEELNRYKEKEGKFPGEYGEKIHRDIGTILKEVKDTPDNEFPSLELKDRLDEIAYKIRIQIEEGKESGKKESGEDQENPESLEELAKELEELKELERRQDSLNEQTGQAAGKGESGQANQDLASEQEGIRRDLEGLRKRKYDRNGKLGEVANLDQAGREMKEGAGDLRRDQPRQAQPHGELASEALGRAISETEQQMSQLAADMVDQLTKMAEQLGKAQGNLRGETEKAGGGQGEKLRENQEGLNQGIEDLLEKIDSTARSLGKFQDRATEDLLKAARDAKSNGVEKAGKRASNALLYDAFSKAQKEQQLVEDQLEGLHGGLQKVEDQLRYGDSTELGELAEQLQKMRQEGAGMGEEEFRQSNEEAASAVGNLPDSDSDERLLNLTQMFEESAVSEDMMNGRSLSAGAVEEATRLIEQFFWQQAAEQNLRRNHQSTRAPARYRKQVQEYFRRIAEGE